MGERPTLMTDRLRLRPVTLADAPAVVPLANDDTIASNVITVPHPYDLACAEAWIETHQANFDEGTRLELGVELRETPVLVGACGMSIDRANRGADIGYWIGQPFRGQGYATEVAAALVRHAFETLGLHRVHAHHLTRNAASGAVLRKAGLAEEGTFRQHLRHRGVFEDITFYGLLHAEYEARARGDS